MAILDISHTVAHVIDRLRALLGGAYPDFTFAWEGGDGWDELLVVRFSAREELSRLFRYEIDLLLRGYGEIDVDDMLGTNACLRIATLSSPGYRIVHGVITHAEQLADVPEGRRYRVTLEPPLALADYCTRSRIFLDKTLRQIIDEVVAPLFTRSDGAHAQGDDDHPHGYAPATRRFCYRVTDTSRLDNPEARPYCVQYNESDFAFLSRLLEEEGISYHFEHSGGSCLLVLADGNEGRPRLGHAVDTTSLRHGARLRPKAVRLGDYDYRKPGVPPRAQAGKHPELYEQRYPGAFRTLGAPLAQARLDRHATEASYATGTGGGRARVLFAGAISQGYLVTRLEFRGEQAGVLSVASEDKHEPFVASYELARGARFRPARATPKPRIGGSQTAFVAGSDDEFHVGEFACVRLRFHWAEEHSCWVRVSHLFAGASHGALFHPRVGDEVIVQFLDEDPDCPIVTGRVYNGRDLPPSKRKEVSVMRSASTPGGGVVNEIALDDTAGQERLSMHAGRDLASHAGNDRSETVTNNASSKVGVDRAEHTGANRSTAVGGNNGEHVAGNETVGIGGNQATTVGANQSTSVGANQSIAVAANQTATIGGAQALSVAGVQSVHVGADRGLEVGGSLSEAVAGSSSHTVAGNRAVSVGGNQETNVGGNQVVAIGGNVVESIGGALGLSAGASAEAAIGADASLATGGSVACNAGGAVAITAQGDGGVRATALALVGIAELVLSVGGSSIRLTPGCIDIVSPCVKIAGGAVSAVGGTVGLN
ncbi:type VI secretion system Vgr family protein [Polyangium aurulentum]|uniref:type VI secretion system Vgr family protein n=1 Tax=Polyangium aurulentum TaxID=2567896 RepID=UPI001F3EE55D|nr:type VI secretion system tip protein TssI/VgrG [Polyangium aurulentum]